MSRPNPTTLGTNTIPMGVSHGDCGMECCGKAQTSMLCSLSVWSQVDGGWVGMCTDYDMIDEIEGRDKSPAQEHKVGNCEWRRQMDLQSWQLNDNGKLFAFLFTVLLKILTSQQYFFNNRQWQQQCSLDNVILKRSQGHSSPLLCGIRYCTYPEVHLSCYSNLTPGIQ